MDSFDKGAIFSIIAIALFFGVVVYAVSLSYNAEAIPTIDADLERHGGYATLLTRHALYAYEIDYIEKEYNMKLVAVTTVRYKRLYYFEKSN